MCNPFFDELSFNYLTSRLRTLSSYVYGFMFSTEVKAIKMLMIYSVNIDWKTRNLLSDEFIHKMQSWSDMMALRKLCLTKLQEMKSKNHIAKSENINYFLTTPFKRVLSMFYLNRVWLPVQKQILSWKTSVKIICSRLFIIVKHV